MSMHWLPKVECFTGLAKKAVATVATNRKVQVVGAVVLAAVVYKKVQAARARAAFFDSIKDQPKGVVYLYGPPRFVPGSPHMSWNFIKIEAFLRANKIPYEARFMDFSFLASVSPTETVPLIAINGKLTGESQFCVDAIAKEFDIDVTAGLSDVDQAQEILLRRTLDQHTVNQFVSRNWLVENGAVAKKFMVDLAAPAFGVPRPMMSILFGQVFRKGTINRLNTSGLGWLSSERYQIELVRDLKALEAVVSASQQAGKKFLFGDTASVGDCLLYAHLAMYVNLPKLENDTEGQTFLKNSAALQKYHATFRDTYYADLAAINPSTFGVQVFNH